MNIPARKTKKQTKLFLSWYFPMEKSRQCHAIQRNRIKYLLRLPWSVMDEYIVMGTKYDPAKSKKKKNHYWKGFDEEEKQPGNCTRLLPIESPSLGYARCFRMPSIELRCASSARSFSFLLKKTQAKKKKKCHRNRKGNRTIWQFKCKRT